MRIPGALDVAPEPYQSATVRMLAEPAVRPRDSADGVLAVSDFQLALGKLLAIAGVPRSAIERSAPIPPADDVVQAALFAHLDPRAVRLARDFAESERRLYESACRQLAENRGVRALQALSGLR